MRIIHTADWHIGVRLENFDRSYEHNCFFSFLFDYIAKSQAAGKPVEALLISGDLYNSFMPPMELRLTLNSFLRKLLESFAELSIYIISGNHDSGLLLDNMDMLCMNSRLHCLGTIPFVPQATTISQAISEDLTISNQETASIEADSKEALKESQVFFTKDHTNEDADCSFDGTSEAALERQIDFDRMIKLLKGQDGKVQALLAMVPFVREGVIGRGVLFNDDTLHTAEDCTSMLCRRLKDRISELKFRYKIPKAPSLAMLHLALRGKAMNDTSMIAAGGLAGVSTTSIDYFDYTALGHIHLRTARSKLESGERVAYSGAPIPVTFAETDYQHAFTVLDIEADGTISKDVVEIPRSVLMLKIPSDGGAYKGCTLDEARSLITKLPNTPLPLEQRPFVTVYLNGESLRAQTGSSRAETAAELRKLFPENYRLCSVKVTETTAVRQTEDGTSKDLESMTPTDVFAMYTCKKLGTQTVPEDLMALFSKIARKASQEEQLEARSEER